MLTFLPLSSREKEERPSDGVSKTAKDHFEEIVLLDVY
jgi:hypothetical protein